MSRELRQNIKAIQVALDGSNAQARRGRNAVLMDYHSGISPGVRDDLLYIHGSQAYKDKKLPQFLNLINKRPIGLPIRFIGGDDNARLAMVAAELSDMVATRALTVKDTGYHSLSLTMFAREIGRRYYALIPSGPINPRLLPDRSVISVVALTEYANTLEMTTAGGILYFVAQQIKRRYGSELAVKFDYISGAKLGGKGGTYPRVQIGFYGNERSRITRRGRKAKVHAPL